MYKSIRFCFLYLLFTPTAYGQQDTTTVGPQSSVAQDDPSQFLTRVEVINELQHHKSIEVLNVTTLRSVIALGKRMTTRFDIPIVYNSTPGTEYSQYGIGDISIRLLGYKILESKQSAMLASVEFSFNTAQSPLLGTGKNVISPVLAYSWRLPKQRTILAFSLMQFYSLWGDETRRDIQWTKFQIYYIKSWTRDVWTMLLPELYLDHDQGGASMNIEGYFYYRFTPRFAVWLKGGAGLFGDHPAVYQWTAETGLRYMMLRKHSK